MHFRVSATFSRRLLVRFLDALDVDSANPDVCSLTDRSPPFVPGILALEYNLTT